MEEKEKEKEKEILFSTNETDKDLFWILNIQNKIMEDKPDKVGLVKPLIVSALDICLKAHRKNGCNSNQLKEMNLLLVRSEDLLK